MSVKSALVLPDLQFPEHNQVLLTQVERYMASRPWDYLLYLGDIMDMDAISHHAIESGNLRALENKRLKQDYADMSRILRRHRAIVGPDCRIYYFKGNHEEWADQLVDRRPGLEGMVEIEYNLPFAELNIEIIRPRGYLKLGKVYFIHGDISAGKYQSTHHAKKVVETYNRNVVYGHHHTFQAFTKISPVGIDETHTAYCLPCLANTQPGWAKDKPNSWLNGFGVVHFDEDNFSVMPVIAVNNSFISPEGAKYQPTHLES